MGRQSRLLSCHFCRVRKLRCNREFPCSNCTSRGVACSAVNRPVAKKPSQGTTNSELLDRLEKVEALLAARIDDRDQPATASASATASEPSSPLAPVVLTPASHCQENLPPKLQNLIKDMAFIDRSCFSMRMHDWAPEDTLIVRTCPIHLVMQRSSSSCQNHFSSASEWMKSTKYIWVPNRPEAEVLVHTYLATMRHINNIAHGPSLTKMVAEIYDNLERGSTQVPVGSIIFLLAIFATVTQLWTTEDDETGLFSDFREANAQAALWIKLSFDAIEGCRRKADVSLECVQGLIILSVSLLNLEGFSSRACSTLYRATAISRELGLHRLDHAQNSSNHPEAPVWTGVQAEVGRRVWWHLTATDWVLACCSGPQRGTYSVNPLHMAVTKPLNLNDDDLTEERAVALPYDTPTSMSYSLQRLRFAEEIRGLVDRAPLIGLAPYAIGYEHIMDADAAIERFLQTTPPFFLLRADSHDRPLPRDIDTSQSIQLQRYTLTLFVYGQRCRLHLPYFVRGSVDPEYSHSRQVALRSARIIIDAENKVRRENCKLGLSRFKMGAATYSYFMAVTILILDLCQLSDENEKAAKLQELEGPWSILEEAQTLSRLITGGVEMLKQVMQKHGIWFSTAGVSPYSMPASGSPNDLTPGRTFGTNIEQSMGPRPSIPHCSGLQCKNMISGTDINGVDWDNLLWVLEAPFL
ncbi:hypothetical protein B0T10DRAFT_293979 [Thelonectria olida]|uniref:Zn(2)-C6 fungal-type domain-containing protein n=1 Tax=Thelonectria olida TaxID=1576542 RepID=A0A9P8W872_9HYPO|nr:hypothetical protein B0T10DRAFT_293979 [Thelonectria olida]